MRVAVVGAGSVGARAVRQLVDHDHPDEVLVADRFPSRAEAVADRVGGSVRAVPADAIGGVDVVVVAVAAPDQVPQAEAVLDRGCHVVAVGDSLDGVRELLGTDDEAVVRGRCVAVGAGFAPGLACLLARHAANRFDRVDEIHVAHHGTGGPACARQHHRALQGDALDWRDAGWRSRRGRTGRELVWFPDPIGGRDCYRASLPGALLLAPNFESVRRVTCRVSATRRDRITALLPMMRRPHGEGGPGAVHVEVRGRLRDGGGETGAVVLGAVDDPSVAAATVAATTVRWITEGRFPVGAHGLAVLEDVTDFLGELARRGVKAAVFEGSLDG